MATKEISVEEKLRNLYELQLIDSELVQIEVLKGELPLEVADLEDEIQGLETRIEKLNANIADIDDSLAKHDNNIKEANALIERYKTQIDNVKNNREYEALSKEIEMQDLEIKLSDKKKKEIAVLRENKVKTLEDAEVRLKAKNENLKAKKVELEKIIEKTEKEEKKLTKISEKQRKKIETRLLVAYDKIQKSYKNGLAVVTVERDSCGGCFNKIPPQTQLELGLHKKIIVCQHCGRILVDESLLSVPKEDYVKSLK